MDYASKIDELVAIIRSYNHDTYQQEWLKIHDAMRELGEVLDERNRQVKLNLEVQPTQEK